MEDGTERFLQEVEVDLVEVHTFMRQKIVVQERGRERERRGTEWSEENEEEGVIDRVSMMVTSLLMFHILQGNTRRLIANGQEFKGFVDIFKGEYKPSLLCIQETLLQPCLDFVVPGYEAIRQDRKEKIGGGCATFVRSDVVHQRVNIQTSLECVVVKVWEKHRRINIVNFYYPCMPCGNGGGYGTNRVTGHLGSTQPSLG